MTAASLKRAIVAQKSAIELCAIWGDLAEESARRRSLAVLERRTRRAEEWTSESAALFTSEVRALDPKDGLRKLIVRGDSGLGLVHIHTAKALRDHMTGAGCLRCQSIFLANTILEAVEGEKGIPERYEEEMASFKPEDHS